MFDLREIHVWVEKHSAEQKAYDGYKLNMYNYSQEHPDEFAEYFQENVSARIESKIESIAIHFSNNYPDFDYNHVIITIPIRSNRKRIGEYKLLLNFDGSVDDDFFIVY